MPSAKLFPATRSSLNNTLRPTKRQRTLPSTTTKHVSIHLSRSSSSSSTSADENNTTSTSRHRRRTSNSASTAHAGGGGGAKTRRSSLPRTRSPPRSQKRHQPSRLYVPAPAPAEAARRRHKSRILSPLPVNHTLRRRVTVATRKGSGGGSSPGGNGTNGEESSSSGLSRGRKRGREEFDEMEEDEVTEEEDEEEDEDEDEYEDANTLEDEEESEAESDGDESPAEGTNTLARRLRSADLHKEDEEVATEDEEEEMELEESSEDTDDFYLQAASRTQLKQLKRIDLVHLYSILFDASKDDEEPLKKDYLIESILASRPADSDASEEEEEEEEVESTTSDTEEEEEESEADESDHQPKRTRRTTSLSVSEGGELRRQTRRAQKALEAERSRLLRNGKSVVLDPVALATSSSTLEGTKKRGGRVSGGLEMSEDEEEVEDTEEEEEEEEVGKRRTTRTTSIVGLGRRGSTTSATVVVEPRALRRRNTGGSFSTTTTTVKKGKGKQKAKNQDLVESSEEEEEEEEDGDEYDPDEGDRSMHDLEDREREDLEEVEEETRKLRNGKVVVVRRNVEEEDTEEEEEEEEEDIGEEEGSDGDAEDEAEDDEVDLNVVNKKSLMKFSRDDLIRLCEEHELVPKGTKAQMVTALLQWRNHNTYDSNSSTASSASHASAATARGGSNGRNETKTQALKAAASVSVASSVEVPLLMQADHRSHNSAKPSSHNTNQPGDEQEEVNALDLESLQLQDKEIAEDKLTKLEKIGSGGFKDVYKGLYRKKTIAIADIRGHLTEMDIKELGLLRDLRHPNIVHFIGVSIPKEPSMVPVMIVTELCANGDLFDYIRGREHPPFKDMLEIMLGIAKGVEYLHTRKPAIIHRDIKSSNVLITANGVAKINDFGLSFVKTSTRSMIRSLVGTVNWQAPELWVPHPRYSEKVDVYSVALVFWEVLQWHQPVKRYPFEGQNEHAIYDAVGNRNIRPSTASLSRTWGIETLAVVEAAWQQDPAMRPSMRDLVLHLTVIHTSEVEKVAREKKEKGVVARR